MSTSTAEAPRRTFTTYGSTARGYGSSEKHTVTVPDALTILERDDLGNPMNVPDGSFVLRICSPEGGDELIAFNPFRIQEVAEAKRLFNELIKKGYYAYKIEPGSKGQRGEVVRRFEDIIGEGQVMMSEIRPEQPAERPLKKSVGAERQLAPEVVMHPRPVGG